MDRGLYTDDQEHFRAVVREFVQREVAPHLENWDKQHATGREVWRAAGTQGIIGLSVPEQHGGAGLLHDFRYRMVVCEELGKVGAASLNSSFSLQDDILVPYLVELADDEQQARWLPQMATGELIMAVAMTEPGTGSDLRNVRTRGDRVAGGWRVNGTKTFITSGLQSDAVVAVVRTDPAGGTDGFTLLVVEDADAGFSRGRRLAKVGLQAQDTAELVFEDVFVPDDRVLGDVGGGFRQLMQLLPLERLGIAAQALAATDAVLDWTVDYVQDRIAFGQRIADFQNTRHVLADCTTELEVTRSYVDRCVQAWNNGTLTTVDASKAKLWATEAQGRITDRCLQMFGGYGWMLEYPIARAYLDARVQRIYGGTSQIMREIVGRDLLGRSE